LLNITANVKYVNILKNQQIPDIFRQVWVSRKTNMLISTFLCACLRHLGKCVTPVWCQWAMYWSKYRLLQVVS